MLGAETDRDRDGAQEGRGAMTRSADGRPVLIIMHQEHSTSGHIGHLLSARGVQMDIRRPRFGEQLPKTLAGHAGAVVFGGPMSANDDEDYIHQERRLITLALKEERPLIGVCLGGQLMAMELGAKVWFDDEGRVEIGYHDVEHSPALAGETEVEASWPTRFYQWHREGFDLPTGAVQLVGARGPFPCQAFRYGPAAYAFQFHPEITHAMVARWSRNEARLALPGAQPRPEQMADHISHGPGVRHWLDRFLGRWLALNGNDESRNESRVCNSATVQV